MREYIINFPSEKGNIRGNTILTTDLYNGFTFFADGPLSPSPTSNSTIALQKAF